eukprot:Rmarinus@m.8466
MMYVASTNDEKHVTRGTAHRPLCRYFPNCTNDKCTFHHPSETTTARAQCRFFPNCTNRNCEYYHPPIPTHAPSGKPQCKFFPNCTNTRCEYSHPVGGEGPGTVTGAGKLSAPYNTAGGAVVCRFDPKCFNTKCRFSHPSRESGGSMPEGKRGATRWPRGETAGVVTPSPKGQFGPTALCKFGSACRRRDTCTFRHPADT